MPPTFVALASSCKKFYLEVALIQRELPNLRKLLRSKLAFESMSKLSLLKKWFEDHKGTMTAFSGGVDSSLVLYVSRLVLGENGRGLISNSESLKSRDYDIAEKFCHTHDIKLEVIKTEEMKDPNYTSNPANRCFYCKNHLYEAMVEIIRDRFPDYTIINGTNLDDLGDYRPGLQAAKKHEIRSPLAELKISKKEVIEMADSLGLETAFKPPSPCLSSRIPYGIEVTQTRLHQIEQAEYILNRYGFHNVRVRYRNEQASIEVPIEEISALEAQFEKISQEVLALGFQEVRMDEEGFVSGKLNRVLNG